MMQKEKRMAKEETKLSFAEKEAARQKMRERERAQGNKDDKAMRKVTEGLGMGLMVVGS